MGKRNRNSGCQRHPVGTLFRQDGDGLVQQTHYNLFHSLHVGGWASIRDLSGQMQVLLMNSDVVAEARSLTFLANFRLPPLPSSQHQSRFVVAQRTSCVFVGWAIFEALANLMAEMAVAISDEMEGAPTKSRSLAHSEIDFLREQQTYFDPRKGETRVRSSSFAPTLEKLANVPRLLASVQGIDYELDRSGRGWQAVRESKRTRDLLTHPKLEDVPLNEIIRKSIAVSVAKDDIVNLVNALTWYSSALWPVIESAFAGLVIPSRYRFSDFNNRG